MLWADAALDALIGDLKSPKPETRIAASEAVRKLGKKAEPVSGDLVPCLKDEYYDVRNNIRETLVAVGKPAVPHLLAALKDGQWHSRYNAIVALQEMGADAGVPASTVQPLLKDPSAEVRKRACSMLQQMAQPSRQLTLDLVALLDDSMAAGDAEAALRHLFGTPSDAAREAAEPLKSLLADAHGDRFNLLSALLNGAGIIAGFDRVLAQYESDRAGRSDWFCQTIQKSNFAAAEVVPVLRKELQAGMATYDMWHLARLCQALGSFGPAAAPGVPELASALKHKAEGVRRYAAQACGNIGKTAEGIVPDLRALAQNDPEGRVREWAAEAVKKIEAAK